MVNPILNYPMINTPSVVGPISNSTVSLLPSVKGLTSAQLQQFSQIAQVTSPVIWKLVWVAFAIGCNEVVPEENQYADRDNDEDGLPNRVDECDDVFARTANGCPPGMNPNDPCQTDRDGDGVVDCNDECPDESHPGGNGCAPDDEDFIELDAGMTRMPDATMPEPWRLLPEASLNIVGNEDVICPHLDQSQGQVALAWQSGAAIFTTSFQNEEENFIISEIAETDRSFCGFNKGVAINSEGKIAILRTITQNENEFSLVITVKNEDGNADTIIDQVFELNQDENNRNKIASLVALPDNGFAVVWIDRDRIRAQYFDNNGNERGRSFQVNQVQDGNNPPQVKSPDVITGSNGEVIFTWQEGNDPQGAVYQANYNLEGERITQDRLLINHPDQFGFQPQALSGASLEFYHWIDSQDKGWAYLDMIEGMDFYLSFGDGRVLNTQAALDESDRLALFWTEEDRVNTAQFKFAGVGGIENGPTDESYPGALLGQVNPDAGLAAVSSGELVYVAIPQTRDPRKLELKVLRWEQD